MHYTPSDSPRFLCATVYRGADSFARILAQVRGATGEIRIPDVAQGVDYDLVCIGSPTWWMKTSVPIRSFLKSEAAGRVLNGEFGSQPLSSADATWSFNLHAVKKLGLAQEGPIGPGGTHWAFAGGQIKSLLSLLSFLGTCLNKQRYLGVKILPTNLQASRICRRRARSQPDWSTCFGRRKPRNTRLGDRHGPTPHPWRLGPPRASHGGASKRPALAKPCAYRPRARGTDRAGFAHDRPCHAGLVRARRESAAPSGATETGGADARQGCPRSDP